MLWGLLATAPLLAAACRGGSEACDDKFFFGTATAAYQIEGYRQADGRQNSLWDAFDTDGVSKYIFSKKPNGDFNIDHGQNAAIADLDFDNFNQTLGLLQQYGFGAYRMSISWTRIMQYELISCTGPNAETECQLSFKGVNLAGLAHYRKQLEALKAAGIITALTMWHWDTPLAIEEYALITKCSETNPHTAEKTGSAWLCPAIVDLYADYAKVLLDQFEGLVDHWITLNEPLTVTSVGYSPPAKHAPGRCLDRSKCWYGNETIEPYYAAKNMMLAHATVFRMHQQRDGSGEMGFSASGDWKEPLSSCQADQQAAVNELVWQMAIFWDLLATGDWAPEIKAHVPHPRLPLLTAAESQLLHGAYGGIYYENMYTSGFAWAVGSAVTSDCPGAGASWRAAPSALNFDSDGMASSSGTNPLTGELIGALAPGSSWLHFTPVGLPKLQRWLNARYEALNLSFVVTENGWGGAYPDKDSAIQDVQRCEYYKQYLGNMSVFQPSKHHQARPSPLKLSDSAPRIVGYFAWSLMDNYEWNDGFTQRFGITYVDYCGVNNDHLCEQTRTPKLSAKWFTNLVGQDRFHNLDLSQWGPLPACLAQ